MDAVHIKTYGMYCDACPYRIQAELEQLPGVKAARAYRTMRMTSVLFDPDLIDPKAICQRIESAGFHADVLSAGRAH